MTRHAQVSNGSGQEFGPSEYVGEFALYSAGASPQLRQEWDGLCTESFSAVGEVFDSDTLVSVYTDLAIRWN